jgi:hypothetical protein
MTGFDGRMAHFWQRKQAPRVTGQRKDNKAATFGEARRRMLGLALVADPDLVEVVIRSAWRI